MRAIVRTVQVEAVLPNKIEKDPGTTTPNWAPTTSESGNDVANLTNGYTLSTYNVASP